MDRSVPKTVRSSSSVPFPDAAERSSPFSRALYNALPNVFWSLLSFVPVSVFCFQFIERRRMGVRWANGVAQHGTLINRLIRRRDSGYRRIRSRADAIDLIRTTYVNERFHWAMLVFFLLSAVYAATSHHLGWALLIVLINVFYNLCLIWLQQYMRIRLERYLSRTSSRCSILDP